MRGSASGLRRAGGGGEGFTLVELLLATLILLVILMVGASLAGQASDAWHNVYQDTQAVHEARQGLAALAAELRRSAPEVVSIDTSPPDYDIITYQVPVGRAGTTIQWGAEGQVGWRVRVTVEEGKLLRTILDAEGNPLERPQVLATQVDGLYRSQKGFSATLTDRLLTLSLRTRASSGGHTWRKTLTTTVRLRN